MDMVSMANDADKAMEVMGAAPVCSPYPYGLRLHLTQVELEKLGYDGLPPAGTRVRIEAVACVTRASSEDPDADGDIDYLCVEMQVTEMGIEEEGESSGQDGGDRAERMYAKGKQPA
jgi:major coat protein